MVLESSSSWIDGGSVVLKAEGCYPRADASQGLMAKLES
jgi:hypothetical protein